MRFLLEEVEQSQRQSQIWFLATIEKTSNCYKKTKFVTIHFHAIVPRMSLMFCENWTLKLNLFQ